MKRCLYITLILLLVVSLQVFGQERSADKVTMPLTGVVYDENGAVIVQALVVAYGPDSQKYEAKPMTKESTNCDYRLVFTRSKQVRGTSVLAESSLFELLIRRIARCRWISY